MNLKTIQLVGGSIIVLLAETDGYFGTNQESAA